MNNVQDKIPTPNAKRGLTLSDGRASGEQSERIMFAAPAKTSPFREGRRPMFHDEPPLYDQVAKLNMFKDLAPDHLRTLTECARRTRFEPTQLIFQEGDPANRFYVILKGSVALMAANKDGAFVQVQTVGPGEDLGWSWLFPPYYWHFTARATEPTEAIFFYGTRLRARCDADRDFGYEITKRVSMVLIANVQSLRRQLTNGALLRD